MSGWELLGKAKLVLDHSEHLFNAFVPHMFTFETEFHFGAEGIGAVGRTV
jgi:hypothetical protein